MAKTGATLSSSGAYYFCLQRLIPRRVTFTPVLPEQEGDGSYRDEDDESDVTGLHGGFASIA